MPTREVLTEEIITNAITMLKSTLVDASRHLCVSACITLTIRLYETLLYYCSFHCKSNIKGTANHIYVNEYMGTGEYNYLLSARNNLVHNYYSNEDLRILKTVFVDNEEKTKNILIELGLDCNKLTHIIYFIMKREPSSLNALKGLLRTKDGKTEYPRHRGEYTPTQVRQLLEESAKAQNWKEIWASEGWDDVNIHSTICIVSDSPVTLTEDLIHWSEDYDLEDYQCLFEVWPNTDVAETYFNVKCIYRDGEWL